MRKPNLVLEWLVWGLMCGASTAWAEQDDAAMPHDSWTLVGGVGLSQDDNLFKANAGNAVSDQIRSATFGIKIDKQYSLQRFTVDATVTDYRYRDNSYLDYTGKNLNAAWAWSLTPTLYGNLSTTRSDALNNFVDYVAATPSLRRNIRTTKSSRFDVEWEALGPLHLLSAVSHYDQSNSQTFIQDDNYSARAGELGVKYVTSKRNYVALVRRQTQGDYSREANAATQLDSGFDQTESEVRYLWMPTVKTSVFGRVAHLDRRYDNFSSRDYDGYVGSVDVNWGITEKLGLLLSLRRDLNAYQDSRNATTSYSSFYSGNVYNIAPVWEISAKTKLSLRLGGERRSYDGTVVNGVPLRSDTLRYRGIGLEWTPRRSVDVNLAYLRQTRDSNNDSLDFTDKLYSLSVLLNF